MRDDGFTANGPATIGASATVVDCSVSYDLPSATMQLVDRHNGAELTGVLMMGESSVSGTLSCPRLQQKLPQPGLEAEFTILTVDGGAWSQPAGAAGALTITLEKID